MNSLSTAWIEGLTRSLVYGSAGVVAAWVLVRAFPSLSPSSRAWIWRIAILQALAALLVPMPWINGPGGFGSLDSVPGVTPFAVYAAAMSVGALVFVLHRTWIHYQEGRLLVAVGLPVNDLRAQTALRHMAGRLGLRKLPRLRAYSSIDQPAVTAIGGGCLLVPDRMVIEFDRKEVAMALAHELSHWQRRDLYWNWLVLLAQALLFFNPLIWLAVRELNLAAEEACDQKAMEAVDVKPVEYGRMLVGATLRAPRPGVLGGGPALSVPLGGFACMRRRLRSLAWKPSRSTRWLGYGAVLLLLIGQPLLLLALTGGLMPILQALGLAR